MGTFFLYNFDLWNHGDVFSSQNNKINSMKLGGGAKAEYKQKQTTCISNETQWKGKKKELIQVTFELNSLIAYCQSKKKKEMQTNLETLRSRLLFHSGINVVFLKLCVVSLWYWANGFVLLFGGQVLTGREKCKWVRMKTLLGSEEY